MAPTSSWQAVTRLSRSQPFTRLSSRLSLSLDAYAIRPSFQGFAPSIYSTLSSVHLLPTQGCQARFRSSFLPPAELIEALFPTNKRKSFRIPNSWTDQQSIASSFPHSIEQPAVIQSASKMSDEDNSSCTLSDEVDAGSNQSVEVGAGSNQSVEVDAGSNQNDEVDVGSNQNDDVDSIYGESPGDLIPMTASERVSLTFSSSPITCNSHSRLQANVGPSCLHRRGFSSPPCLVSWPDRKVVSTTTCSLKDSRAVPPPTSGARWIAFSATIPLAALMRSKDKARWHPGAAFPLYRWC